MNTRPLVFQTAKRSRTLEFGASLGLVRRRPDISGDEYVGRSVGNRSGSLRGRLPGERSAGSECRGRIGRGRRREGDVGSVAALQVVRHSGNDALTDGVQDQLRETVEVEFILKIAAMGFHGVRAD